MATKNCGEKKTKYNNVYTKKELVESALLSNPALKKSNLNKMKLLDLCKLLKPRMAPVDKKITASALYKLEEPLIKKRSKMYYPLKENDMKEFKKDDFLEMAIEKFLKRSPAVSPSSWKSLTKSQLYDLVWDVVDRELSNRM